MDGLELLVKVRSNPFLAQIPVLMLTAVSDPKEKLVAYDHGVDDYLTKPFEFEELAARIRALLRRKNQEVASSLKFEDLEMDLLKRKVTRGGKEIVLTQKEFALLEYFLRHPNQALSRTQISEHVWDVHFDTDTNVIDVYVNLLRKKVDQPFKTRLIQTVVGTGYALKKT
jgi:DNA-binding response OmpR family regulator